MHHPDGHAFRRVTALFCALLVVLVIGRAEAEEAKALKGVALIIGQSAYETLAPLPNPERDAPDIEDLLAKLGFATDLATDAKAKKLRRSVEGFIEDAEGADVALIYYSGHGIEAGGVNYLIPIDADQTSLDAADDTLISLQAVLEQLRTKARITILLLDACRSNPFPKDTLVKATAGSAGAPIAASGLGAPRGAVVVETAASPESIGEVIGFAAEPGQVALDGTAGANSPYAAALLKHLAANQGYDFGQVMTMVTEEVYLATGTRQRPWTNASLRRFLSFGGAVDDPTPDDTLLTGERRKLLLAIAATPANMRAAVESLARDQSLPLDPLYGMLKELQVDTSVGPEDLDKQLRAGAENLKKLLAERVVPLRKDAELTRLAGLAERAQAEGAIALAKDYRAKASARADELDKMLDQREAEVTTDRMELASTYSDYAGTAILAFDYRTAAEQYAKAFGQVAGRNSALSFKYKMSEADALADYGNYKGDNDALRQAISIYQAVLKIAARDKHPDAWAVVQNALGLSLTTLGDRDGDVQKLFQAAAAYEAALTQWSREREPNEWAMVQNNLGNVLQSLGKREINSVLLTNAVTAYEAALAIVTRERAQKDWATIQNNLGNVLHTLGSQDNNIRFLQRAVTAHQAALTERTRERAPLDWAETQNNLGIVLQTLGEHENSIERLTAAVAALRAALTERTRERVPLEWASTQNSLGAALQALEERRRNSNMIGEAIASYEAALIVIKRQDAPPQWAMIQSNLAAALATLGERNGDKQMLLRAVAAHEAVLSVRTRESMPLGWAAAQDNLGMTLRQLGELENNFETLKKALDAFQSALQERTRERAPLDWASTLNNIGLTLNTLGERNNDPTTLMLAVSNFEAALTEWTRERVPFDWARVQNNLGNTLQTIGERGADTRPLIKAIAAYEAATTEWTREGDPLQWAGMQNNIGWAKLILGERKHDKSMVESGRKSVQVAWDVYKGAGDKQYDEYFRGRMQAFDLVLAQLR